MEELPTLWAIKNKLKTEKGLPIDFHDHYFMYDVWNAMATEPKICAMKAAQITFSTTCIMCSFWVAKKLGMDGIYTLPTSTERDEFVSDKVNRIIAQNPILQEYTKDKDSIAQKQIGENMLHYRSTWAEKNATTVSSDVNYYDEVDTSDMDVIDQYATRLQHSKYQWERWFSHPSAEKTGVHVVWLKSTQNHWFITCKNCGVEHYMDWDTEDEAYMSVDIDKGIFICRFCKHELSDEDRRSGRWISKYKKSEERDIVGFWIPLIICPWFSAKQIIKYYNEKTPEYFENKVMGRPFAGSGNKLTRENFNQNLTLDNLYPDDNERVVMGLDTGTALYYVLGGEKGIFHYGVAKNYEEIESMMKRWPRMTVICDQMGDLIGPRELREKYPGRVYLCLFGEDRKTKELIRWGKNDEQGAVIADRNRLLSLIVDEFRKKRIRVMGEEKDWEEYMIHWDHLTRKIIEDSQTGSVKGKKWFKNGQSDFPFATAYWRVGMSRFGSGGAVMMPKTKHTQPPSPTILPGGKTENLIFSNTNL